MKRVTAVYSTKEKQKEPYDEVCTEDSHIVVFFVTAASSDRIWNSREQQDLSFSKTFRIVSSSLKKFFVVCVSFSKQTLRQHLKLAHLYLLPQPYTFITPS
jgi:hypothetical protein